MDNNSNTNATLDNVAKFITSQRLRQVSFDDILIKLIDLGMNKKLANDLIVSSKSHTASNKHTYLDSCFIEDSDYLRSVREFLVDNVKFNNFKRDPRYLQILEHVTREQGEIYLDIILSKNPALLSEESVDKFANNDKVGNPLIYDYGKISRTISPSTLRYIKVVSDLQEYFHFDKINKIAEIGCGYGGQSLVLDQAGYNFEFTLFDLPDILKLIEKYLECHTMNGSYQCTTLNKSNGKEKFDLVVSNYAFSEVPKNIQLKYIEKVISQSTRGYLTMNTGHYEVQLTETTSQRLTANELKELLPKSIIIDDVRSISDVNYIIIWGHEKS